MILSRRQETRNARSAREVHDGGRSEVKPGWQGGHGGFSMGSRRGGEYQRHAGEVPSETDRYRYTTNRYPVARSVTVRKRRPSVSLISR
jgi:hypothetical protein